MKEDLVNKRYLDSTYLDSNPDWDSGDAPWKAKQVAQFLNKNHVHPESICDIGCGSGACLFELRKYYPYAELKGYDIAPDAMRFWNYSPDLNISFYNADASQEEVLECSLLMMLDVIEHVADPHAFIQTYAQKADLILFHIPLDLSSQSVLRESPLLYVRNKVGHIHYYTRSLALSLLRESGLDIIDSQYTNAAFSSPQSNWKTVIANLVRRLTYLLLGKEIGVRLLGGETLLVLARTRPNIP
jgi:hypothetical protein